MGNELNDEKLEELRGLFGHFDFEETGARELKETGARELVDWWANR